MMKRVKLFGKSIIVLMIAAMFLFGCGSNKEEAEETPAESEAVEDLVIEEQEEEKEEAEEVDEEAKEQEAEKTEEKKEEKKVDKAAVEKLLADAEKEAAALEKKLAEDASLSQADMNELSNEIYVVWDDVLNELWGILKDTQDEDTMNDLLKEQREWIDMKETEAQKAGEEFAGGSMQALVVNQKAAELTRERVYELADYLGV